MRRACLLRAVVRIPCCSYNVLVQGRLRSAAAVCLFKLVWSVFGRSVVPHHVAVSGLEIMPPTMQLPPCFVGSSSFDHADAFKWGSLGISDLAAGTTTFLPTLHVCVSIGRMAQFSPRRTRAARANRYSKKRSPRGRSCRRNMSTRVNSSRLVSCSC